MLFAACVDALHLLPVRPRARSPRNAKELSERAVLAAARGVLVGLPSDSPTRSVFKDESPLQSSVSKHIVQQGVLSSSHLALLLCLVYHRLLSLIFFTLRLVWTRS